jgi:hypothetical protein
MKQLHDIVWQLLCVPLLGKHMNLTSHFAMGSQLFRSNCYTESVYGLCDSYMQGGLKELEVCCSAAIKGSADHHHHVTN